jgi:hypothetical protein
MPIFIAILTTIRCHPSLAQNDLAKPSSGISRGNGRWCHHDAHTQGRAVAVSADRNTAIVGGPDLPRPGYGTSPAPHGRKAIPERVYAWERFFMRRGTVSKPPLVQRRSSMQAFLMACLLVENATKPVHFDNHGSKSFQIHPLVVFGTHFHLPPTKRSDRRVAACAW